MKTKSYAKVNINLRVGKKLENTLHEIFSLAVCINLYDIIKIKKSNKNIITSNIKNFKDEKMNNIIDLYQQKYNIKNHVKIHIKKNIPFGAGLGGSSSNLSSIINLLDKFYKNKTSLKDKIELAKKYGSDTIFFLHNKPAIIKNDGTEVQLLKINKDFYKNIYLIFLPVKHWTKEVYDNMHENKNNLKDIDKYLSLLNNYKYREFWEISQNDLLKPAQTKYLEFNNFYNILSKNTQLKLQMSGSGSTLFTLDYNFLNKKTKPKNIAFKKYKILK